MKHLIMGTAGHVDHGKTALIKALTGFDCDTHKEEQTRGITINLGFSHLDISPEISLGIVDVPGHKDFVHTMVGGATGIDFALLLVAADSGVMPQTREHLQIMDVLGIPGGLVAVSRIDLVDEEIVLIAEEEIRELLAGTFLQDCPLTKISSVTGEGLDELRQTIEKVASNVRDRSGGEVFRMFADRIFSVSGFGTVVTGSVMSGILRTGDTAYLLPGEKKELRVRRLERHGKEVDQVLAGDRASLNLVGLDRGDFKRGMIISDRILRSTTMVDARLRVFPQRQRFQVWNQVLFHLGTFEGPARVHLIDRDSVSGGETALVQIHLNEPCVAQHGDRFVVRTSSSDVTLGGGEIIDAAPLHHRRRPEKLIETLTRVADGQLPELILAEVKKQFQAVSYREIAESLNISPEEVLGAISGGLPDNILSYSSDEETFLIGEDRHAELCKQVLKKISAHHRRHPLDEQGRTIQELTGTLGILPGSSGYALLRLVLEKMTSDGKLKKVGRSWALREHSAQVDAKTKSRIEFIETFLRNSGMQTPLMSELSVESGRRAIDARDVNEFLRHLVSTGKAYFVEGEYIHASVVDRCRKTLLKTLIERDKGITVSEFRDLVRGNRKICLLLLAIYDGEGVTERQEDLRVITDKGRQWV
ncbi:selenocysteine-specific translation elongation factor [Verrucomicrobiota bacterium]